ncbi:MAG: pentapeptide repeat-containing protein [Candidatus Thiodiazotropha sp. (ex Rostrolucina anterorostrata)]|nr:pentapeptide repeat-containing protein [Candidatus Thiodiazotropha sp. (ex Rostrolucina anterorostrata)]
MRKFLAHNLTRPDLFRASLTVDRACQKCDLKQADLRSMDLHQADLRGAKLDFAMRYKTDLKGAQLEGALGIAHEYAINITLTEYSS